MLLDEKRTKRTVQVVAILTSVAFAGVIFVVVGMILFGGGTNETEAQVDELKGLVQSDPNNADLWQQLASAQVAAEKYDDAVESARKSVELEPRSVRGATALAQALEQSGDLDGAVKTWQQFTAANPKNAEGYLQLGSTAQQAGRNVIARLSYQQYLALAPDSSSAEFVREQLTSLSGNTPKVTTGGGS